MAWTAEFEDGPLGKPESGRTFMAPGYPETIWFAKVDPRAGAATVDGWVLIGYDPGPGAPDPPWPEMAEYRLDHERSTLGKPEGWQPGEDEGHAIFVYVEGETDG